VPTFERCPKADVRQNFQKSGSRSWPRRKHEATKISADPLISAAEVWATANCSQKWQKKQTAVHPCL